MTEYTNHPAAELFPMMEQEELHKLAEDIKENGLLDPVVLYHGQILDGRNRLAACKLAGITPRFTEVNGEVPSPTLFVASKNLHRRHLEVSQRAAIGARMVSMLEEESRRRQLSGLKNQQRISSVSVETNERKGPSSKIAADAVGVSKATINRALKVMREDPKSFEKLERGEGTVRGTSDEIQTAKADIRYVPDTPRKLQVAEAQKKKMEVGLAAVGGTCHGLDHLDVVITVSVCTEDEVELWATKAEQHASDLRKFAKRLRGAKNG